MCIPAVDKDKREIWKYISFDILFIIFTVIYSSKRSDDRANVLALKSLVRDANFTKCEDMHKTVRKKSDIYFINNKNVFGSFFAFCQRIRR